jgi:hypothetical protein
MVGDGAAGARGVRAQSGGVSVRADDLRRRRASVGFSVRWMADDALARLIARPNGEQAGPDLMETFYGHIAVTGDAYLEAVSMDGEVRELFVLRPDRMKALKGAARMAGGVGASRWQRRCAGFHARRMGLRRCFTCGCFIRRMIMRGTPRWRRQRGRWTCPQCGRSVDQGADRQCGAAFRRAGLFWRRSADG